jgi:hypothetical protein
VDGLTVVTGKEAESQVTTVVVTEVEGVAEATQGGIVEIVESADSVVMAMAQVDTVVTEVGGIKLFYFCYTLA